ncbi:hypothetical protein M5K25_023022 [Dendrobium thyrsiflorum]|uniref:Retrovirus-related Pol polyprotein from transposon TNT 1-94 n=1 Tax=Dendrobium thyrsiflorum TaxID=117978 RepID=A0ABD0UE28_DENTH
MVNTPLTTENHLLWRSQILKVFAANGFEGFLTGSIPSPPRFLFSVSGLPSPNPAFAQWTLIDQNLTAALYSIISPSLLPYILNLTTCAEVWQTLDKRLQSSNRSRLLQLKSELHHIAMKDQTMTQYLSTIKAKVDAITAAGSQIDPKILFCTH